MANGERVVVVRLTFTPEQVAILNRAVADMRKGCAFNDAVPGWTLKDEVQGIAETAVADWIENMGGTF